MVVGRSPEQGRSAFRFGPLEPLWRMSMRKRILAVALVGIIAPAAAAAQPPICYQTPNTSVASTVGSAVGSAIGGAAGGSPRAPRRPRPDRGRPGPAPPHRPPGPPPRAAA